MPSVSLPLAGFPADAPILARGQSAGRQGESAAGGPMTGAASRSAFEAALEAARGGEPSESPATSATPEEQAGTKDTEKDQQTGVSLDPASSESADAGSPNGVTPGAAPGDKQVDAQGEAKVDAQGDADPDGAATPASPQGPGAPGPQPASPNPAAPAEKAAADTPVEPAGRQPADRPVPPGDKPGSSEKSGAEASRADAGGQSGAGITPPSSSASAPPAAEPAPSPDAGREAATPNPDTKPDPAAKPGDAAPATQTRNTSAQDQAGPAAAPRAGSEAGEAPTAQRTGKVSADESAAPATKADAKGDKAAAETGAKTVPGLTGKAAPETAGQGLSGLKADPDAALAESRRAPETPAAQRAAFGQARADRAAGGTGDAGRSPAAAANPTAAPSPGPAPSSRPLADLIALQLQTAAQGAPLVLEAEAAPDTSLSFDAESGLETGQTRTDARADAVRLPGQAGQAARFTPQTVQHLAGRMAQTAADGGRTLDIRLDPAELGRVRVRLEMGADNSVRAFLSAERPDTLAELQRTARELEKALADAGLDLADNGLEFSLSQGGDDAAGERRGAFTPLFAETDLLTSAGDTARSGPTIPETLYGFALSERTRLDVRI